MLTVKQVVCFGAKDLPRCIGFTAQKRGKSDVTMANYKRGTGGRSSFSGRVVTVFGATGFLGRYVINKLGKTGNQIIVPWRGDEVTLMGLKPATDLGQLILHEADMRNEDDIRKSIKYSDTVINLIGRDYETSNYAFEDVHVETARKIARCCKEAGVDTLIHFSALNAEGFDRKLTMKKTHRRRPMPKILLYNDKRKYFKYKKVQDWSGLPNGKGTKYAEAMAKYIARLEKKGWKKINHDKWSPEDYRMDFLASKYYGELAVREEFPEAIIFRPSVMYGSEDRFIHYYMNRRRRTFDNDLGLLYEGEKTIKQPVFVDDVAAGVMSAMNDPSLAGKTIDAVGPERFYLADIINFMYSNIMFPRQNIITEMTVFTKFMANIYKYLHHGTPIYTHDMLEREFYPDTLTPENPTLEDLNVKLARFEDKAPFFLKPFVHVNNKTALLWDKAGLEKAGVEPVMPRWYYHRNSQVVKEINGRTRKWSDIAKEVRESKPAMSSN